jgi:outer membrane protein OmpA-like peptidoglycan-associated protein
MHSDPITLYTGTADADGNFNESVKIPATACLAAGLHELVLTGITPTGEPTSDAAKFTLVDGCKIGATALKTGDAEWTMSGFLFDYMSSKLTKGGKSSLKALKKLLKGATHITITGYTQTNVKSKAEKAFNKKLAKARTLSVERYLKSIGVKSKWTTIGAGAVNPVSLKYQAKNRRVVIKATY